MTTVLIVDDNPDELAFTVRVIRKSRPDVNCIEARNGEAALAFLATGELPVAIFMDLKMPGMSGIDTLARIRTDGRLRRIPVIILTNSTLESDEAKAMAAGADEFLHKAFDLRRYAIDIEARLQRWAS